MAIDLRNERCPYLKQPIKSISEMCPKNFMKDYEIDKK